MRSRKRHIQTVQSLSNCSTVWKIGLAFCQTLKWPLLFLRIWPLHHCWIREVQTTSGAKQARQAAHSAYICLLSVEIVFDWQITSRLRYDYVRNYLHFLVRQCDAEIKESVEPCNTQKRPGDTIMFSWPPDLTGKGCRICTKLELKSLCAICFYVGENASCCASTVASTAIFVSVCQVLSILVNAVFSKPIWPYRVSPMNPIPILGQPTSSPHPYTSYFMPPILFLSVETLGLGSSFRVIALLL